MKPQGFGAGKKFMEVGVFREKSDIAKDRVGGINATDNAAARCSDRPFSDAFSIRGAKSHGRLPSKNPPTSSASPFTCNSTRPSARLRTHPVTLNPFAICLTE